MIGFLFYRVLRFASGYYESQKQNKLTTKRTRLRTVELVRCADRSLSEHHQGEDHDDREKSHPVKVRRLLQRALRLAHVVLDEHFDFVEVRRGRPDRGGHVVGAARRRHAKAPVHGGKLGQPMSGLETKKRSSSEARYASTGPRIFCDLTDNQLGSGGLSSNEQVESIGFVTS